MATITLTTSPQELAGSTNGAFIKGYGGGSFIVAFSATSPSDGFEVEEDDYVNYSGGMGSAWVWQASSSSKKVYYAVAV